MAAEGGLECRGAPRVWVPRQADEGGGGGDSSGCACSQIGKLGSMGAARGQRARRGLETKWRGRGQVGGRGWRKNQDRAGQNDAAPRPKGRLGPAGAQDPALGLARRCSVVPNLRGAAAGGRGAAAPRRMGGAPSKLGSRRAREWDSTQAHAAPGM